MKLNTGLEYLKRQINIWLSEGDITLFVAYELLKCRSLLDLIKELKESNQKE